jgi:hypothetical protein
VCDEVIGVVDPDVEFDEAVSDERSFGVDRVADRVGEVGERRRFVVAEGRPDGGTNYEHAVTGLAMVHRNGETRPTAVPVGPQCGRTRPVAVGSRPTVAIGRSSVTIVVREEPTRTCARDHSACAHALTSLAVGRLASVRSFPADPVGSQIDRGGGVERGVGESITRSLYQFLLRDAHRLLRTEREDEHLAQRLGGRRGRR